MLHNIFGSLKVFKYFKTLTKNLYSIIYRQTDWQMDGQTGTIMYTV